jgi:hypothetical protein
MSNGIYILANDKVLEQAIALVNSIRYYDSEANICLIPYDAHYQQVAEVLANSGVFLFPDLALIDRISEQVRQRFGERFFLHPNHLRKLACWFGPFEQFLYIDTDVVVFEPIIRTLKHLEHYDFVCCDYQHKTGIANVFRQDLVKANVFPQTDLFHVFNSGFWASKRHLFTESELFSLFDECAQNASYFDFSKRASDQPILNYLVLKKIPNRCNLARQSKRCPGNWAGRSHFRDMGSALFDPNVQRRLKYLHWAGIRISPGCNYWSIWLYYRNLFKQPTPSLRSQPKQAAGQLHQAQDQIKTIKFMLKLTLHRLKAVL